MGNPPTNGLTGETRELLTLIRDALDLPRSVDVDGDEKRQALRNDNAIRVICHLDYLLTQDDERLDGARLSTVVSVMRKSLADNPVDYATKDGEAGR